MVVFPNKACLERCLNCSDTSVQGLSTDSQISPSPPAASRPRAVQDPTPSPSLRAVLLPQPSTPSPKSGLGELLCVMQSAIQVLSLAGPHARAKSVLLLSVFPQSLRCIWAIGCIPHSVCFSMRLTPRGAGGAAHLVSPARWPGIRQVAKVLE